MNTYTGKFPQKLVMSPLIRVLKTPPSAYVQAKTHWRFIPSDNVVQRLPQAGAVRSDRGQVARRRSR